MKKFLIALAICSLVVFALVTTVMADNYPHGNFAADTSACAGCHRVHTAKYGSNALLIADPEALCETCHAGFGAGTDVEHGVYVANGQGLNGGSLMGGGFDFAVMATKWSGKYTFDSSFNGVSKATTSEHNLGTSGTVWGSGANNSVAGTYVLECTSCHDPHGSAGWTNGQRVATYRLLRFQPSGSGGFEPPSTSVNWSGGFMVDTKGVQTSTLSASGWTVPDNYSGAEWYTIGDTYAFAKGDYSAGGPQTGSTPPTGNANGVYRPTGFNYIASAQAVSYFCAQCHDRYFNNSALRNNTDRSAYCNSGVNPPTSELSVHPTDPTYCKPFYDPGNPNATPPRPASWGWGDNRPSGDTTYMYRHTSGDLRASMDGTVAADTRTTLGRACVACHVAHGTTAAADSLASNASEAKGSVLLRMDNRSICLRCHAGAVNYTIQP